MESSARSETRTDPHSVEKQLPIVSRAGTQPHLLVDSNASSISSVGSSATEVIEESGTNEPQVSSNKHKDPNYKFDPEQVALPVFFQTAPRILTPPSSSSAAAISGDSTGFPQAPAILRIPVSPNPRIVSASSNSSHGQQFIHVARFKQLRHANALSFSKSRTNRVAATNFSLDDDPAINIFEFSKNGTTNLRSKATFELPQGVVQFSPQSSTNSVVERLVSVGDALRVWDIETLTVSTAEKEAELEASQGPGRAYRSSSIRSGTSSVGGLGAASAAVDPTDNGAFNWGLPDLMFESCRYYNKVEGTETSFFTCCDWFSENLILTGSTDTTVSLWDLAKECVADQLIAHDREVLDVCWLGHSSSTFVTAGADGSVRLFDLRDKGKCEVKFESHDLRPVFRCVKNPTVSSLIAIAPAESSEVDVIDLRNASASLVTFANHTGFVNSVSWVPGSDTQLISGGEDCMLFHEDIRLGGGKNPVGSLRIKSEVNACVFAPNEAVLAVSSSDGIDILRPGGEGNHEAEKPGTSSSTSTAGAGHGAFGLPPPLRGPEPV